VLKFIRSSLPPFKEPRLGHHVQMMIAAKYVMTDRNNVVKRTGDGVFIRLGMVDVDDCTVLMTIVGKL